MAILENFSLKDASRLQDFDSIALGTHNATRGIIETHLQTYVPGEVLAFHTAYERYIAATGIKEDFLARNGTVTPLIVQELDESYREYNRLKRKHANNPALAFLRKPIHRKVFNVLPYEIEGKHAPTHPYLGATAAMDGLWPGYDKSEYFAEYPFLDQYAAKMPGKAMQAFLREHNLFFNFPETVSRYGVLFVPPPYLDDDLNVELRQHLSKCDILYHTAPTLSTHTTVAEAKLVLSYVEDDMVAVVLDEGKKCVGVIGWQDLIGAKDVQKVESLYKRDWHEAPSANLKPQEAFEYMTHPSRDWLYMLKFTDHGPRIVTQTTASIAHFLPPHQFKGKEGLGSALYLGISDVSEGDRLISRLMTEADGVGSVIVETAHADTEYFRSILRHYRQKMQDVFMMAGTTISPEAVHDFLIDCGADGVKLGIAEGRACRTSHTGIALPNAHVGLECGFAAYGQGYLMLDGWGNPDEFIKGLAMSGIQMRQGGGAFVGRRESANPWLMNGRDIRGKYYRGMAGADVQEAMLGRKHADVSKQMEAKAHLHSEGAEVFVQQRSPSTVGRMLLAHMFLLKSAMSYEGVRQEVEDKMGEKVLKQFQRMAKMYAVPSVAV